MPTSAADRIRGAPVPLQLNPDREIHLKFNMLSAAALEARYGEVTPLLVWTRKAEEGDATHRFTYLIAAACLHESSGLDPDLDAIEARTKTPAEEAERLSWVVLRHCDDMLGATSSNAIAKAIDMATPLPACANDAAGKVCGHAFGDHDWVSDRCELCDCGLYQTPGAMEAKRQGEDLLGKAEAAPAPSTGTGTTTPPQRDTAAATGSSGG